MRAGPVGPPGPLWHQRIRVWYPCAPVPRLTQPGLLSACAQQRALHRPEGLGGRLPALPLRKSGKAWLIRRRSLNRARLGLLPCPHVAFSRTAGPQTCGLSAATNKPQRDASSYLLRGAQQ
ncbi:hypothetical protein NDU88_010674 [Pleurodeles waltl]|uniref:Uncharacterized protein n=1 Tax=Pleurodeles waltl TaxID=8319 RepID=A0AAV7PWE5_PLEWA|nr:hypothetical protein NDU88_010674 [Pleurodeles waltl]